jgi:hypothetical protein
MVRSTYSCPDGSVASRTMPAGSSLRHQRCSGFWIPRDLNGRTRARQPGADIAILNRRHCSYLIMPWPDDRE